MIPLTFWLYLYVSVILALCAGFVSASVLAWAYFSPMVIRLGFFVPFLLILGLLLFGYWQDPEQATRLMTLGSHRECVNLDGQTYCKPE